MRVLLATSSLSRTVVPCPYIVRTVPDGPIIFTRCLLLRETTPSTISATVMKELLLMFTISDPRRDHQLTSLFFTFYNLDDLS